ncbi:conserved hypothetical protein [Gluconacetobacter diazotrophicus PA1 5]|uniref:hypothetical protein n=1 Tax=Gluconacetobacter diazotrophicus TaxID=33996 RepID=UPI000173D98D|nr:hypothetical protein [Gluconacetobacter diazotrophicus]ACI52231.1 conserved hypothetical protein [Gluconacetobacter diazotrophicus PA1 5]
MTQNENALTIIQALTPQDVFGKVNSAEDILSKLEADVRAIPIDVTTEKGRKHCKSVAYQVARSKTALDDMGKQVQADAKAIVDRVNAERRTIRERLDALSAEVRKPVDEFEARETERVDGHKAAIIEIEALVRFDGDPTEAVVEAHSIALDLAAQRDFEEFSGRATQAIDQARSTLNAHAVAAKARRIETEEAARQATIRAEEERKAAASAQAQREAEIARQAAEQARRDAEEAAARELAASEQRRRDDEARAMAEQQRIEQEKRDAIEAARRAEEAHKAEIEAAKHRAQAAAERAERDRVAAVEAERQRVADEAARQRAKDERRAQNRAHCSRINNEALAAITALGIEVIPAKALIGLIAKGQIPHVTITY